MHYITNRLTNVEIALLEIIKENNGTTGYEIGQIIEERGYKEWANIGKTSTYAGIKKLEQKGFVTAKPMKSKKGKGPLPNKINLTKSGEKVLAEEIRNALLSQKNLPLYYLGIAGIRSLERNIALETLRQREVINRKIIDEINMIFRKKGGDNLPLEAKALFEHPMALIKSDSRFLAKFIKQLESETNG